MTAWETYRYNMDEADRLRQSAHLLEVKARVYLDRARNECDHESGQGNLFPICPKCGKVL